jgi:hypothetical protein
MKDACGALLQALGPSLVLPGCCDLYAARDCLTAQYLKLPKYLLSNRISSKLGVQTCCDSRDRSAIAVIGGVDDKLIIDGGPPIGCDR